MNLSSIFTNVELVSDNTRNTLTSTGSFYDEHLFILNSMNEEEQLVFFKDIGMIRGEAICPDCGIVLTEIKFMKGRHPFFKCKKSGCKRIRISAVKNSIFECETGFF